MMTPAELNLYARRRLWLNQKPQSCYRDQALAKIMGERGESYSSFDALVAEYGDKMACEMLWGGYQRYY